MYRERYRHRYRYIYIYIHIRVYVCMYVCIYVCMYVCMHVFYVSPQAKSNIIIQDGDGGWREGYILVHDHIWHQNISRSLRVCGKEMEDAEKGLEGCVGRQSAHISTIVSYGYMFSFCFTVVHYLLLFSLHLQFLVYVYCFPSSFIGFLVSVKFSI